MTNGLSPASAAPRDTPKNQRQRARRHPRAMAIQWATEGDGGLGTEALEEVVLATRNASRFSHTRETSTKEIRFGSNPYAAGHSRGLRVNVSRKSICTAVKIAVTRVELPPVRHLSNNRNEHYVMRNIATLLWAVLRIFVLNSGSRCETTARPLRLRSSAGVPASRPYLVGPMGGSEAL
jgi:hypothetical protein